MFDLIREISQTLKHNKLRTALTGFAVAWGIFMLIILLGASRGVVNSFLSFSSTDTSNTMSIWGGWTTKPYKGYKEGRRIRLHSDDLSALAADNRDMVSEIVASKVIDTAIVSTTRDYLTDGFYGIFPKNQDLDRVTIIKGRFINNFDMNEKRKVVVLQKENAELLFGSVDNAVGSRVDAMGLSWLVIGVYEHRWNKASYVPFTTAMKLTGTDGRVSNIAVVSKGLKTTEDGDKLEKGLRTTIAEQHEFSQDDDGGVHIWNRFNQYLTSLNALNILNVAIWLIGIFTLLSGIVGVSNIMFVSVRERTHEIGIRRAIGAKPRSILLQIVMESVSITTLFGYIGIALGMIATQLMAKGIGDTDFMKDPTVDISIAIKVTIVLIIAGSLAGIFPAMKATKVKPVEALRDE